MTAAAAAETFQAQYPLALGALASHMLAHKLPAPWSIDTRGQAVIVLLHRDSVDAWISTVEVDAAHTEERQPAGVQAIRTEWEVRLPDPGTGFQFRFIFSGYQAMPSWKPAVLA